MQKLYFASKTISILAIYALLSQSLALNTAQASTTSFPPIYVSIVTHNEQPGSGRYPDFTTSEKDNEHFLTHNDDAVLPVIGTYTSDWDGLNDLLTQQTNGELDPNSMYTATIMVDQDELLTESDRDAIQAKIEALKDETAAGRIIWTTLEDALTTWQTTYNSTPSLYQASSHTQLSVTTSHTTESQTTTETPTTTATAGTLIKTTCSAGAAADDPCTAVYYLTSDGLRHAFPNDKVFFTWYENFDGITTISAADMTKYTLGKNVTYRPGTRMVKFVTSNTVYAVSRGGELRPIASEAVATALYGTTWNTQIDDISDAFYGNYTFGSTIDSNITYNPNNAETATPTIEINLNGT